MGQLWDRMRRVADSYINDFTRDDPDYANLDPKILEELRERTGASKSGGHNTGNRVSHKGYETEEERLKRIIDEAANPQAKHHDDSSQSSSTPASEANVAQALSTLGIQPNASIDDMKKAYKKLMMQYHPDRVSSLDANAQNTARDKAQRINHAYQVLKDTHGF
jgi:hypothetical protein